MKTVTTYSELIPYLAAGEAAVAPTDTLYGVLARALDPAAVELVYSLRHRTTTKACILLISDLSDLEHFGVTLTAPMRSYLEGAWPGPVSIIMSVPDPKLRYLHRGNRSLAFRVPAVPELRDMLRQTGPVIAPTANSEGQPPATTIAEAQVTFGAAVAAYMDAGVITGRTSRLVRLDTDGSIETLRA